MMSDPDSTEEAVAAPTVGGNRLAGGIGPAMVAVREDGRIALASPGAEALLGYSWSELADQPLQTVVPELGTGQITEGLASDAANAAAFDVACRRKDGSLFPAHLALSSADSQLGPLWSLSISDRQEHERTELRSLLASIVRCSTDAIIGTTLDGVITAWNPAAENMFGYHQHEVIGRPATMLLPPSLRGQEALMARVRKGLQVELHQAEHVRKDGRVVTVSVSLFPVIERQGQVIAASTANLRRGQVPRHLVRLEPRRRPAIPVVRT